MFRADKGIANRLDGKQLVIGIVQARFNQGVTNALAKACWDELLARGVQEKNIEHGQVPGALEVPLALQAMAEKGGYDALIALGCIVRGETYHFELVANESGAGVTRIPDPSKEDPQVQAIGLVVEVPHPTRGTMKLIRNGARLSETPTTVHSKAPELGQHR